MPQVRKVVEGDNLSIACNVSDSTDVAVFWKRNGTMGDFYQNGTVLKLNNVDRNDTGFYNCFSYNLTCETEDNATEVEVIYADVLCEFYSSSYRYFHLL